MANENKKSSIDLAFEGYCDEMKIDHSNMPEQEKMKLLEVFAAGLACMMEAFNQKDKDMLSRWTLETMQRDTGEYWMKKFREIDEDF